MKVLLLPLMLLWGCGAPQSKCGPPRGTVDYVIDGDTIALADDAGTHLRLLLVDTPEITKGKNDCYGHEAAAFTTAFVTGKTLDLSYDENSCTDRYGRTLAYVKVNERSLVPSTTSIQLAC